MYYNSTLLLAFLFVFTNTSAQYSAGQSYFDSNSYIEYIAGNLPIILTAAHGGYQEPAAIPNRNCTGCSYLRDAYTQELTRELKDALFARTGCYPHVIVNLLHRKKLDANRVITDAADGDPIGETAWQRYHDFIDSAKNRINQTFGKGLYLDMHGHAHTVQRLELGYLISKFNLQQADSFLNNYPNSSIHHLTANNLNAYSKAALIRGPKSFGTLCEDKGYPAIPSSNQPFPVASEPYFSGGYNTDRHGSKSGGTIDGIQIECHSTLRFNTSDRQDFADSLAGVILDYLMQHYFVNLSTNYCLTSNSTANNSRKTKVFPNPTDAFLYIHIPTAPLQISIYNTLGNCIYQQYLGVNYAKINLSRFEKGVYYLQLKQQSKLIQTQKIIKK